MVQLLAFARWTAAITIRLSVVEGRLRTSRLTRAISRKAALKASPLSRVSAEKTVGAAFGDLCGGARRTIGQLAAVRDNLRRLMQQRHAAATTGERRYG